MGFSRWSTMWEEKAPDTLKSGQIHVAAASAAVVFSSVGRAGALSIISVVFMVKNPFKKT
jgi:hypothetical protein